jgi:DNA-binding HxlR family transcriptional regulator
MKATRKTRQLDPVLICGHDNPLAIRELLTKIGDKWTIFLILALAKVHKGRARFSELEQSIPTISQRMLTVTLRNLERDGLITREVFPEVPPRVEYELTNLGKSLLHPMEVLFDWVSGNWEAVKKSQSGFDAKKA